MKTRRQDDSRPAGVSSRVKRRPDEGHRHRHGISDAGRFDDKVVKRLSTQEQLVEPSDEALILEALTERHDQIFLELECS